MRRNQIALAVSLSLFGLLLGAPRHAWAQG
jgi:hypothetical protein